MFVYTLFTILTELYLCLYGNLTSLSMCIFNPHVFLQFFRFINRAIQVRDLLNKHFEQKVERIITSLIIRFQNDRVYYGIGPGMHCVIKLN